MVSFNRPGLRPERVGNIVTTRIHFGVIVQPYRYVKQKLSKKGKVLKKGRKIELSITTGEVAEHIEEQYQLFEFFYNDQKDFINEQLLGSLENSIEAIMSGAAVTQDPFGQAASLIEDQFKKMLSSRAFDGRIEGVATLASKNGVNHRLAHPYAKSNPMRPSFIDTGNFEASFKVWVDDNSE